MTSALNTHGDMLIQAGPGLGADIASQRQDELDGLAIEQARLLAKKNRPAKCLDLGCGRGAQSVRLLQAGALLAIAVDQTDFSKEFKLLAANQSEKGSFLSFDLSDKDFGTRIKSHRNVDHFDIVVFQRTLHYFPYNQAKAILKDVVQLLAKDGRLYLSASGMGSELSQGYIHADSPMESRFSPLSRSMAQKHGITTPVCLYHLHELVKLCSECGLRILMAQESDFGNVKIVAEHL